MTAMKSKSSDVKESVNEGRRRLMWAAFNKKAFEALLQRFSTLNDNMTDILDVRLQTEIHRTTQDTNRGVLQLHKDLISLQRLVMALDIKMQARTYPEPILPAYTPVDDASGLRLLAQLAKFKAFNESMDAPSTRKFSCSHKSRRHHLQHQFVVKQIMCTRAESKEYGLNGRSMTAKDREIHHQIALSLREFKSSQRFSITVQSQKPLEYRIALDTSTMQKGPTRPMWTAREKKIPGTHA